MNRPTLLGCLLTIACSTPDAVPAVDLASTLRDFLVGAFDSSAQAQRNPEYFEIQLLTCDVSAPELGELVVYVEQAFLDTVDQPYRQRLYVITSDSDTQATTEVYALNDEASAIGLCDTTERPVFTAADVVLREGCGVEVDWDAATETFTGGTVGSACSSDLSGASYATSEVTIGAERVNSWDRGFDANDVQVWGAVSGPYRFRRR